MRTVLPASPSRNFILPTTHIIIRCCCCCQVASVMSDSVQPHRWWPTRLLCPWDSLDKNTRVDCHFLLPYLLVYFICVTSNNADLVAKQPKFRSQFYSFLAVWSRASHLTSVQFSHSIVSDSLQSHEPQHARPPCPSPAPRVYSNSCPLSR